MLFMLCTVPSPTATSDLTRWEGGAIVNAANEMMLGGAGVDGAIHKAAGPQLRFACFEVEQVSPGVRCPTGEARITPGFNLPAKHVIHTVGPVYRDHTTSAPLLRNAIKNSLLLCKEADLKSIAFPAISCGIYAYPPHEAAKVAIAAMLEFSEGIDLIEFVLFGRNTYDPFTAEASRALVNLQQPDGAASDEKNDEANEESKGKGLPGKSEYCEQSAEGIPFQPETASGSADEGNAMDIAAATTSATVQENTGDAEGSEPKGEEKADKSAEGGLSQLETSPCATSATPAEEAEDATVEPMSQSQDEDFISEPEKFGLVRDDVEVQEAKRQKPATTD